MAKDDETPAAAGDAPKKEKPEKPERAPRPKGDKKKAAEPSGPAPTYKRDKPPKLKSLYDGTVRQQMMKEFSYSTVMQVPRVLKITVNMGLGKAKDEPKMIDNAIEELKAITGQSPVVSRAKKDIAVFKLRKGQKIGGRA